MIFNKKKRNYELEGLFTESISAVLRNGAGLGPFPPYNGLSLNGPELYLLISYIVLLPH